MKVAVREVLSVLSIIAAMFGGFMFATNNVADAICCLALGIWLKQWQI